MILVDCRLVNTTRFIFQYQQQQTTSIPQPPQGEVGSSEPEEMEQSAEQDEPSERPTDTEMTDDNPGSPIVNEVEQES